METTKENKTFVFANWGERVYVLDVMNRLLKGVITEFDTSDERNTKVVYKGGKFDWFNRDEIEELNVTIEKESIKVEEDVRKENEEFSVTKNDKTFCCSKCSEIKDIGELRYSDEDNHGEEVFYCNTCADSFPVDGDSERDNLEDR